jgi:uncharacterized protein
VAKSYVDSNVFFYAKIMDRVFGEPCSRILRDISSGNLQASTSALVPIEVANALRKYGLAKDVVEEIRAVFSLGLEIFTLDQTDALEAAEIYGATGISPYDCLHAAVMKKNGLSEIISADKEFEKVPWMKRLDPRIVGMRRSNPAT